MSTQFTFDSPKYIAVVFGPQGGIFDTVKGETEDEVRGPAMAAWARIMAIYQSTRQEGELGSEPIWDVYVRAR